MTHFFLKYIRGKSESRTWAWGNIPDRLSSTLQHLGERLWNENCSVGVQQGEAKMPHFELESPAFARGEIIPEEFTGHGRNLSPPLRWKNPPAGTKEFALICEDPDAPTREPFVHWIVFNIPPGEKELDSDIKHFGQGMNSSGVLGYMGPKPPPKTGMHRYFFRMYALDENLDLPSGISKKDFLTAIQGHVLGEAEYMGRHEHH